MYSTVISKDFAVAVAVFENGEDRSRVKHIDRGQMKQGENIGSPVRITIFP